jgi:outer membrane scaffolding protein for murein synthesis (MipA/OmpV family)
LNDVGCRVSKNKKTKKKGLDDEAKKTLKKGMIYTYRCDGVRESGKHTVDIRGGERIGKGKNDTDLYM